MFRSWASDEDREQFYLYRDPIYLIKRAYLKNHPAFHKSASFLFLVLLIIINIYLIVRYHVPNWICLSFILLAIDDYRIAGSDTYHSIISFQRHNLIVGLIYIIITTIIIISCLWFTGVPDPFGALYGYVMIDQKEYVSIPYCLTPTLWSKTKIENPEDLKDVLNEYKGYHVGNLYKYQEGVAENEFKITNLQGKLKYDITIEKNNNYYSYCIKSYDE